MTMKCQWVYYIKCLQQYKLRVSLEYTMAVNQSPWERIRRFFARFAQFFIQLCQNACTQPPIEPIN